MSKKTRRSKRRKMPRYVQLGTMAGTVVNMADDFDATMELVTARKQLEFNPYSADIEEP